MSSTRHTGGVLPSGGRGPAARATHRRHPVDVVTRRNLGILRRARGWSLVQQERHTGIKPVTMGSYERGDRALRVDVLARICRVYGVSVADMFEPMVVHVEVGGAR